MDDNGSVDHELWKLDVPFSAGRADIPVGTISDGNATDDPRARFDGGAGAGGEVCVEGPTKSSKSSNASNGTLEAGRAALKESKSSKEREAGGGAGWLGSDDCRGLEKAGTGGEAADGGGEEWKSAKSSSSAIRDCGLGALGGESMLEIAGNRG